MVRTSRRLLTVATGVTLGAALQMVAAAPVSATSDGHVWLQPVGPCPDHQGDDRQRDGQENRDSNNDRGCKGTPESGFNEVGSVENDSENQRPLLPCENIELMGNKMETSSGAYHIDSVKPTDSEPPNGARVYPSAHTNGTWVYNLGLGADQVMAVIDVHKLVANALAAGAEPNKAHGLHFRLVLDSDSASHKGFWVNCHTSPPPQIPETPLAVFLPLSALLVGGGAIYWQQRRRRPGPGN